jgi:hypothetical protein
LLIEGVEGRANQYEYINRAQQAINTANNEKKAEIKKR